MAWQYGEWLFLSVALSLDAVTVGVAYGLRGIRIPGVSLLLISLTCAGLFALSLMGGGVLASWVGPAAGRWAGGVLLIGMGIWIALSPPRTREQHTTLELPAWVLKHPEQSDLDRSGTITGLETVLIGTALALDSLGVGLAAALGHPPRWLVLAVLVGLANGVALRVGLALARAARRRSGQPPRSGVGSGVTEEEPAAFRGRAQELVPAAILVVLGLLRLV